MRSQSQPYFEKVRFMKQRGVALFFALIALLVLSLAAVALIRSVDTSTMIAGNLAFKQAATTSSDAGVEAAITWLTATEAANVALNVITNPAHPFNQTSAANGYYSNANPALDLFADATWNVSTIPAVTDGSGNSIRYIIQRMCRNAGVQIQTADCLFSDALQDTNGQDIPLPQDICTPAPSAPCPMAGQTPQMRVTTRTTGPKNTVSYVQVFVY